MLEETVEAARESRDALRAEVAAVPLQALMDRESRITSELTRMRNFGQKEPFMTCPHCAEPLVVRDGKLEPFDSDSWEEQKLEYAEAIPGLEAELQGSDGAVRRCKTGAA